MALRSHIVTKSSHTYECRWSPSDVGGADMTGRAGKTRNIWLVWLVWPLITIGWIIIVPPYVSIYNTGQRIAKMQEDAGPQPSCNPWIGVLLAFVASLQALYYQSELNNLWAQLGNPEEGALVALPVAAGARTTGPITTPNIPPTETPLAGRPDTTR